MGGSAPCLHYCLVCPVVPKAALAGPAPDVVPSHGLQATWHGLRCGSVRWKGACSMAQRLGGAPLLVARSIGSPHHSSEAWHSTGTLPLARRYCCAGSLVTGAGRRCWDQR